MLNHGLQMNDLQTELPAYPEVEITRITIFKRTIVFTLQCHSKCNEVSSTIYNEILLRRSPSDIPIIRDSE